MGKNINIYKQIIILLVVILGLNYVSGLIYHRFDLTHDKRYTLSEAAIQTLETAESTVFVEVLLEGSFPAEFRRLQSETRQILEEFASKNEFIKFEFTDPAEDTNDPDEVRAQLAQLGILPAQVSVQDGGKMTQELIYPWAIIMYEGRMVKVNLMKNQLGASQEERITNSIQNLEYAFADGFNKIITPKSKKVAVLSGNGQLPDRYIADFITTLREYYFTAKFTLDSVSKSPQKTLEEIKDYDLLISAQPRESFTDEEKYVLDQYTINGGKSLWLVDQVNVEMDSLYNLGYTYAIGNDLNLTDFFFRYGVRINPTLVNDLYSAPIVLATGSEADSQFDSYPWFYSPLTNSANNHPIVNNIEAVKFDFASAIDTLENDIKKTILLSTSPITREVGIPTRVSLDQEIMFNLEVYNNGPDMEQFSAGEIPLAVLLEGRFTSVYRNRVKPFLINNHVDEGRDSKMVIISDGNVIKNQMQGNRPLELGFDKWTNNKYGNKEFLLNTVNYLLDENGLINIRSKEIIIPFLDQQNVIQDRTFWQSLNLVFPLVFLFIFGGLFSFYRKRKYT